MNDAIEISSQIEIGHSLALHTYTSSKRSLQSLDSQHDSRARTSNVIADHGINMLHKTEDPRLINVKEDVLTKNNLGVEDIERLSRNQQDMIPNVAEVPALISQEMYSIKFKSIYDEWDDNTYSSSDSSSTSEQFDGMQDTHPERTKRSNQVLRR